MLLEERRHRLGVKSEKFDNQYQNKFDFGENNTDCQKTPELLPEILVPAHKRKKKSKSNNPPKTHTTDSKKIKTIVY